MSSSCAGLQGSHHLLQQCQVLAPFPALPSQRRCALLSKFSQPVCTLSPVLAPKAGGRQPSGAGTSDSAGVVAWQEWALRSLPPCSQVVVIDGCIRFEREQVTTGQPPDSSGSMTQDREH